MRNDFGTVVVALLLASGIPAAAHHSNQFYFDVDRPITLEGRVLSVRWVNPHILLFLETKNDRGEVETWTLQGTSLNNAMRVAGLKERLQPGISIAARVWPSRNALFLDDADTVLPARPGDARTSSRIVGGGHIRLSNGVILAFGGAPRF
jgi:hypothetical protein